MVINSLRILRNHSHWILVLLVLVGILTMPGTSWAQQLGQITGRVTDADSKEYLPGANVMLKGTGFGASSDRNGVFRVANVPAGDYEIVVRYIGYEEFTASVTVPSGTVSKDIALKPSVVQLSGISITGLRQGQNKALNIQKSSDNILNVVSSEQMLRLPDLNAAEILQRVPGISIVRDQGEGRYVQIRGTDARLTSVSVNGERLTAPDAGERFVGMDVVSASQAASIEVVKALTPDMDADAIGGSVNLVTKSGFDSDKPYFNIQAGTGYSDMLGKPLWQGNFTYGAKLDGAEKLAIAVTGNYDYWKRETWDLETGYNQVKVGTATIPIALVDMDLRNYLVERERWNVAANLDFRPNENNQYFLRGMYNNRDDYEYRRSMYVRPSKGTFTSADVISNAKIYRTLKDRLERQNIATVSAGGIHKMDNLRLDYSIGYTNGGTEKPDEVDPTFVMAKKVNLSLNQQDPQRPLYAVTSTGAAYDQFNSDNYKLDGVKYNRDKATDRDYMGAANLKYSYDIANHPSELKIGGKMHIREKVKEQNRWVYAWGGSSDLLMTQFDGDRDLTILDGAYKVGTAIDGNKFREYFKAQKDKAAGFVGDVDRENSDAASFTADENIVAYYAMNTLHMDDWMLLAGVRHEFTNTTNKSNQILLDADGNYVSTTKQESKLDYNNLMPMVHIRYKLTPMTNIRLAFTTGIARPNFYDLVPYRVVLSEDNQINQGNPSLKPTTASSLDLMGEHYFQAIGMISGGVFYKKLNDIIFTHTTRVVGGIYDGWYQSQPLNGGSSTLLGFELNWQQQLTFLPGFLNGLGLSANFAHTKSTADVGGRLERSTLPGQAENVANFAVSYEKFGFSGRFSISYNGSFIEEVGEDADHDRIYKNHMQMDFSASQQLYRGFELYFEVINLNKEPMIYYMGQESRPLQQEFYSWWMHVGIKYDLK